MSFFLFAGPFFLPCLNVFTYVRDEINRLFLPVEAHQSILSRTLAYMKRTNSRFLRNPESDGIYLSDLNADELDPEVAALYLPTSHRGPTIVKGIGA